MPDFDFPDIKPRPHRSHGAFISAKRGSRVVTVSKDLTQELGVSAGDRTILAKDSERIPWIGFVSENELMHPDDVGPPVKENKANYISSSPIVTQLRPHLPAEERRRFYLTGQTHTVAVQGTQVTLHELTTRDDDE